MSKATSKSSVFSNKKFLALVQIPFNHEGRNQAWGGLALNGRSRNSNKTVKESMESRSNCSVKWTWTSSTEQDKRKQASEPYQLFPCRSGRTRASGSLTNLFFQTCATYNVTLRNEWSQTYQTHHTNIMSSWAEQIIWKHGIKAEGITDRAKHLTCLLSSICWSLCLRCTPLFSLCDTRLSLLPSSLSTSNFSFCTKLIFLKMLFLSPISTLLWHFHPPMASKNIYNPTELHTHLQCLSHCIYYNCVLNHLSCPRV